MRTPRIPTTAWMAAKLVLAGAVALWVWQLPPSDTSAATAAGPTAAPKIVPSAAPKAAPAAKAASRTRGGAQPAFVINSALALDRPLSHGDYAWSDDGVPAGPTWIHVDIARQTLRVIRGTSEIGRAIILYGADNKPTPLGAFKVTEKDADHVSNLYGAPMPYMLRLTNDGIAIHGSDVKYGEATHGCIGVPEEFAAILFAEAELGDRVIITGGSV